MKPEKQEKSKPKASRRNNKIRDINESREKSMKLKAVPLKKLINLINL